MALRLGSVTASAFSYSDQGTLDGAKVNAAMREIEKHNPQLAGVLPKTFNLFTGTLLKELLKKISEIPATLDFDAFGRIYEYFLGEFAMSEGQGGGEFYTPSSIVRLLTEVIEPYHGRILDLAGERNTLRGQRRSDRQEEEHDARGPDRGAARAPPCRRGRRAHDWPPPCGRSASVALVGKWWCRLAFAMPSSAAMSA